MNRWGQPCMAITARGQRCGRPHSIEVPVTFTWDPVRGIGYLAPLIGLCRMHDYVWDLEPGERVEIVDGWMGRGWNPDAECWTVLTTVYAARDAFDVSPEWYAQRYFGNHRSERLYDPTGAACAP